MQQKTIFVERIKHPAAVLSQQLAPVFTPYLEMLNGAWSHGTLEPRLKELLRLKSADLAGCVHCVAMRYIEAQEGGLTEATIAKALGSVPTGFAAREQAALDFSAAVASDPDAIAKTVPAISREFSLAETVEITVHVLANNMYQSFGGVTHLAPSAADGLFLEHVPAPSPIKGIEAVLAPYPAMNRAIWRFGSIEVPLKELLRLKSAELSHWAPGVRARNPEAKRLGLTEGTITKSIDPGRSDLPEREKLALQFGEMMITGPKDITDSFFDEVRLHYSEVELLELCWFALTYKFAHRFNFAMQQLARYDATRKVAELPEFA